MKNKLAGQEELSNEEWRILAETLAGCVERDQITETEMLETENKTLTWTEAQGLEKALYLIIGKSVSENAQYTLLPYLITVPGRDVDGRWIYQVVVDLAKFEQETDSDLYKVIKIWRDKGYENNRPKEVTVELLKDGKIVDTQVLNEKNNWRYTWNDLEAGHEWKVIEKDVPEYYTMSCTLYGKAYIIINTYKNPDVPGTPDTPNTPEKLSLPQTGQLWWPVPVMAGLGLLAFMIGWIRRRDSVN